MSQVEHRKAEEFYSKAIQISQKDPVEALCLFKKAIFLSPEHWKWYYGRAKVCIMIGDISSAILNAKKAHYLNRGEKKVREQICLLYDMDGLRDVHNRHIDLALEKFSTCLRYIDPYPPALLHRGTVKLFFKRDQAFEALKDLESCREACVPYVNVILGQYYLQQQDLHKASVELEMSRKDHQYVPEVMAFKESFDEVIKEKKLLLRKLVAKRDFVTGKVLADELIGLRSKDYELYFLRGIVLRERTDFTEAVKDFLFCKQSGFEPENSQVLLGKCLYSIAEESYQNQNYMDCVEYMDECIQWQKNEDERIRVENIYLPEGEGKRRREDRVRCHVLRGDAYLQLQKYEYAINDYRKAHNIEKNEVTNQRLSRIHLRWGKILMNNAKLELSEKEFTKAIDFLKNDCEAYLFRAKCRFSMNDESRVTEAVEDLVAYYLMNNRNESVNKLVYQYIPQIVYSSRIQRHYRRKFGLSTSSSSSSETDRKTQKPTTAGGAGSLILMNPSSSTSTTTRRVKSANPSLMYQRKRSNRRRRKRYGSSRVTYSSSSPQQQHSFYEKYMDDVGGGGGSMFFGQTSSYKIEKPLIEFTEENRIKLPELYSKSSYGSNLKRDQERNISRNEAELLFLAQQQQQQQQHLSQYSGMLTGLSVRELRRSTREKKKKDRIHKMKLKRIRDRAIAQPSTNSNPVRRIQDRHSKVLNISSERNSLFDDEEEEGEYSSSSEEEDEDYSSYSYGSRRKKRYKASTTGRRRDYPGNKLFRGGGGGGSGGNSSIWSSNQKKFVKWRESQKKYFSNKGRKEGRILLRDIGDGRRSVASGSIVHAGRRKRESKNKKRGKKRFDPLKMVL